MCLTFKFKIDLSKPFDFILFFPPNANQFSDIFMRKANTITNSERFFKIGGHMRLTCHVSNLAQLF